jgi:hypothetical protein
VSCATAHLSVVCRFHQTSDYKRSEQAAHCKCIPAVCTLKVKDGQNWFYFDATDAQGHVISYHEAKELVIEWVRESR